MQLLARDLSDDRRALSLGHSVKVPINERVRISLPTDAGEPTVEEPRVLQHLPHRWVAPVIRNLLWENFDSEVIMSAREHTRRSENFFHIQANKVLPRFLESVLESLLVFLCFSFSVRNESVTVPYEDEHPPRVDSVERSNICDRI